MWRVGSGAGACQAVMATTGVGGWLGRGYGGLPNPSLMVKKRGVES